MNIRKFEEKDRENIRKICLETCFDKYFLEHKDVLYLTCCDYYMNEQSQHIFVAVDDKDDCVGYILCCPSYKDYIRDFKNGYMAELSTMDENYAKERKKDYWKYRLAGLLGYTSHLHIDLSPTIQRMGVGTALVDALFNHLQDLKVKGLFLSCFSGNEKGNSFYLKYGFKPTLKLGDSTIYTMKFKNL